MNGLLLLAGGAVLALTFATVRAAAPAADKAVFEARFAPLRATVLDAGASFRVSEVYPKLEAIEQVARRIGADSPERARVLDLMSLVRFKQEDFEDTVRLGDACLSLQSVDAIPPAERILLIHRVATSAEHLGRHAIAEARYRAVLALDADAHGRLLDDAQRLGVQERIGYVLHEAGRPAEALAANRAMLAQAERLFGADDDRLTTVLVNIAQNSYLLGRLDESEAALRRALAIARKAGDDDVADDALFQLGVLAFERGDLDGARRWMRQRTDAALQAQDDERLARAKADADELERRIEKR